MAHGGSTRSNGPAARPEHDPEKCAAVFPKDHAQTKTYGAMTVHPNLIAL
jgi:hypothetical protein